MNEVTKLTVHPRLELLLLAEPLVVSRDGTDKGRRPGEVFAGFQGVIAPGKGERPTVSFSYIRRLHASPAPELDLGTFLQNGSILVSGDWFGFHYDAHGIVSEQTAYLVRRAQFAQTLSISHPIGRFTISGEIWHFTQPFPRGNAVGNLWSVSYSVRKIWWSRPDLTAA